MYWHLFLIRWCTINLAPWLSETPRRHWKKMHLNCWIKLAVERLVCLNRTSRLANHSLSLKSWQHVSFEHTVPLLPLTLTFLTSTSRSLKKSMKVEETKMRTVRHPPKGEVVSRLFWSHWSFFPPWLQMCKMVFQHSSTCFSASGSDGSACRLSGRLPWCEA